MSDKSFGDCPSRNIVKNPLLSTAVTGLSIEDLTHNAVLVPVAASQGLTTGSDHQIGANTQTLGHADHEFTNFPSGDSNTNVFSPQATISAISHSLDYHHNVHQENKPENTTSTVSKALPKSEDDFDVNEYFARLQGTRYVSAPINSNPDQNANLEATEDNLEEINLNDDKNVEIQQSLTADIAQNFSQLPTVLPHVASAVFSSFSNMLNYKSREQTPDEKPPSYQDVMNQNQGSLGHSFPSAQNVARDTPLMAEDVVKEVAPPPKELPPCGASNFRITTKKKYAQIPGLSSGQHADTAHDKIAFNPLTQNVPSYFVPTIEETKQTEPPVNISRDSDNSAEQNHPNKTETYNIFNPIDNVNVKESEFQPIPFNMSKEDESQTFTERLPPPAAFNSGNNTIPPPPMFSTQKRDSQSGKSVLPPSVARRIGSNHPVIKPQVMQSINTDNIFIPTFDPTAASSEIIQPNIPSFSDSHSQTSFGSQLFATNQQISHGLSQELSPSNAPGITPPNQFIMQPPPGFASKPAPPTNVIAPPNNIGTRLPPQKMGLPPSDKFSTNTSALSVLPPTLPSSIPTMFLPSSAPIDPKANSGTNSSLPPSSNIFSSAPPAARTILPPAPAQPPPIGPTSFTPSTTNIAPPFYSSDFVKEQPKPEQIFASEPPKPLTEPPKPTGSINYRMNKKRPQYYSGPIEGVGSISNSIKPVIPSLDSGTFQGSLFTPQPQADQNVPSSIPFDISKPADNTPFVPQYNVANQPSINVANPLAFDITQQTTVPARYDITNPIQNNDEQYNTAFDFSRPTTDSYQYKEEPKESKGFGIIGSLKSKLSSIDINKIQHSVTTFFDPAYNDSKKDDSIAQENTPFCTPPYQAADMPSNLEIFVPNAQQSTPAYNYDYQQRQQVIYDNNQYYKFPNFQNQGQPNAGHCSNSNNYPSETYSMYTSQDYRETAVTTSDFYKHAYNAEEKDAKNPIKTEESNSIMIDDNQEKNTEKQLGEIEARFESDVTENMHSITAFEEKPANNVFNMESINLPNPVVADQKIKDPDVSRDNIHTQIVQESPFGTSSDSDHNKLDTEESKIEPMSFFESKSVDLYANATIENKDTKNEGIGDMFTDKKFYERKHSNISNYAAQTVDLFTNVTTETAKATEGNVMKLFATASTDNNEHVQKSSGDIRTENLITSTIFDSKELIIPKDSLLESLSKDDVPILGVSSEPLFGLSTILTNKSKDSNKGDEIANLTYESPKFFDTDKNSSLSFFDHAPKPEKIALQHMDILNRNASFSFFENVGTGILKDEECHQKLGKSEFLDEIGASEDIVDDVSVNDGVPLDGAKSVELSEKIGTDITDDIENISELSICETCREVNKPEDKEYDDQDLTTQLIENITSPIQLSNPVEAPLPEATLAQPVNAGQVAFDKGQCEEISHITEETIETIQVQSASELLDKVDEIKGVNYGWTDEEVLKPEYSFSIDPNSIGFFGNNKSLFFDKVPANAVEVKHNEEMLARQMSVPSAPPAEEEDSKSDEAGILDVHSIEQDANKDFPLFEEFVIEPETNDDKIEYKESNTEDGQLDSFTNRVERYKNMDISEVAEPPKPPVFFELPPQPIGMASYFDTGNYAAETYYRNANTMPTPSIPPGFEEEFRKRLALAKMKEEKIKEDLKTVPETSTQTKPTLSVTYSTAQSVVNYTSDQVIMPVGFNVEANITSIVDDQSENLPKPTASDLKPKEKEEKESKLPDPINFLAGSSTPTEAPENFNRLASYFSSPPKTDHAKSFFELSQSQNHYRHVSAKQTQKLNDLMKDLTSVQNISIPKDQTTRHVNYFTVEYDAVLPDLNNGDNKLKFEMAENETDKIDLDNLFNNCRYCSKIFDTSFRVRTAVNENSEGGTANPKMEPPKESGRGSVTVNFDGLTIHEEPNEGVAGMTENRSSTEYTPVKHHWFYRVDVEDKSIWRGFSVVDSRALETAYLSPDLNDETLVATDGGRYDVNVVGRLRIPIYWNDKPTNVRRCSWFYKGTTDARYVPYTEPVAEKLEEEYRHGMTTGEWHRRLVLPNGEVVVMHGPSVMVHFLHSDAFSTPPLFSFGKRVYRNPPKIRVSRDQPEKIDHLIFLVHGAGEYKCQKEKIQSSSRPRVVRRGHDESEIEDTEPSSIDHLLLLCHGVGSACDMRFRSVEEVVEDFRTTSLQLIQSHYRNSYDQGIVSRVEVLPISWHATLHSGETGVDRRLAQITLDSIPRLRSFTNDTVLDVLFYTSPVFCQTIINTVCKELNRIYQLFVQRNPTFKGGVSLGGHSLGSVILYDLLCHQTAMSSQDAAVQADKHYVRGSAGTGQPCVQYPSLAFAPDALYALGSPIAIFECIRGVESLGASFSLPTCKNFFNIFHPYDPIAYRIEPLINPQLRDLKPFLIPHHKGRKRMHLELKDTMARVGADLKQKLFESLKSTWYKWKAQPPTDGQLEKVVEEEIEKEQLCDDNREELARETELSTPEMLGRLNGGRRVDYVLQEAPLEMINEYLFAMSSHVGYWESEDTMLLMLREIYSALGVQPDSTVPQQNMTVQRTRKQDETIVVNASEFPSTSHGTI